MKQKYIKWLLVSLMLIITVNSYSQSVNTYTIDYSFASLDPNTCNVFAKPTIYNGYIHQTTLGRPYFVATNSSVVLKCDNIDLNSVYSTQYRIAFSFKKNFKYKISTYNMSTTALYRGQIGLNFSSSGNSVDTNLNCSGPGVLSVTDRNTFSEGAVDPIYSWTNNIINSAYLLQDMNYLIVAALPYTYQNNPTYIYLQKIQITETSPFSLSSSTSSIACGSTSNITFTANNLNSVSGITGYTWNLGANNSWQYNGSAAASTITTAGNSITLTSTCSNPPSSIFATVNTNSGNFNTNNVQIAVTQPSLTISGANYFCSGTSNYTINNLPCSATVSWSLPTGTAATLSTTGNTATLTQTGNGNVDLAAHITNICGGAAIDLSAVTIQVGIPVPPSITLNYDKNCGTFLQGLLYNTPIGVTQYNWNLNGTTGNINSITLPTDANAGDYLNQTFITNPLNNHTYYEYLRVSAQTPCGPTAFTPYPVMMTVGPYIGGNCGGFILIKTPETTTQLVSKNYTVLVYPNPAKSSITITVPTDSFNIPTTVIQISDASGRLVKTINSVSETNTVPVSSWSDGAYIITVTDGKKRVVKQILKQ